MREQLRMQIQQAVVDMLTHFLFTRLNQTTNSKSTVMHLFAPDYNRGQHWKTLYWSKNDNSDFLSAAQLASQEKPPISEATKTKQETSAKLCKKRNADKTRVPQFIRKKKTQRYIDEWNDHQTKVLLIQTYMYKIVTSEWGKKHQQHRKLTAVTQLKIFWKRW